MTDTVWQPDCLGEGFEVTYVAQPDDYAGKVRCAVIRYRPDSECRAHKDGGRAVLYVHGYSDYFFQREMAEVFARNGYNFYAVDLRKYGRSLLEGQRMFQVRDLREYFADIDAALEIIKSDGNQSVVLVGHSTGGLITSLYMTGKPSAMIDALVLNSPFLEWNLPAVLRRVGIPVVSALGRLLPGVRVAQQPDRGYAESLLSEFGGEWNYNRKWKPDVMPDPDMGWVRAIEKAQKELRRGRVHVPVLLMHSAESVRPADPKEKYSRADAILDVELISRRGKRLGDDVTEVAFDGGLHDLVLSRRDVRKEVYLTILSWLRDHGC